MHDFENNFFYFNFYLEEGAFMFHEHVYALIKKLKKRFV